MSAKDLFLERSLPSSVDAERSVLGSILLDNRLCNQAMEALRPDDFYLEAHRRIYEKMISLSEQGRPIDPITLGEELRRIGEFEQVGGGTYLAGLIDSIPRLENIEQYAKIVKDRSTLRRLIAASNQIIASCFEQEQDSSGIIDSAEKLIFSIAEDRMREGFTDVGSIAHKRLEEIESMAGRAEMITGVPTGFTDLDKMTAGLQRSDLVIVAARPSMGKTSFAMNVAQYAARSGYTVGVFSLEMSSQQLVSRLLCSESHIDAHRFRTGYLNREEWARLADGLHRLSESRIYIDDSPGITVLEMRAKARRLKQEHGLDMLLVDYLQLIQGRGRADSRTNEVSQISRDLKMLAKELNCPVIALSQLSRAPETRTDHRPQLSDLRESGCLAGDTLVTMADSGARVPIRELVGRSGFRVWALNEATMRIEAATVSSAFPTGTKPVFRLETKLGRVIRATANHKFRTFDGWRRLDELEPGDRLALPALKRRGRPLRSLEPAFGYYLGAHTLRQNVSRERLERVASAVGDDRCLSVLAKSDVYWDKIVSIIPDGAEEVFDLTVDDHHNFEANGYYVHNSIEQDADVVAFIYREEMYGATDENQGVAELIIGKQRNGPTGVVRLAFLKEFTRFENLWNDNY